MEYNGARFCRLFLCDCFFIGNIETRLCFERTRLAVCKVYILNISPKSNPFYVGIINRCPSTPKLCNLSRTTTLFAFATFGGTLFGKMSQTTHLFHTIDSVLKGNFDNSFFFCFQQAKNIIINDVPCKVVWGETKEFFKVQYIYNLFSYTSRLPSH